VQNDEPPLPQVPTGQNKHVFELVYSPLEHVPQVVAAVPDILLLAQFAHTVRPVLFEKVPGSQE
jgi:hypothetical protein